MKYTVIVTYRYLLTRGINNTEGTFKIEYNFDTLTKKDIFMEKLLQKKYITIHDLDLFCGVQSLSNLVKHKISLLDNLFWHRNRDESEYRPGCG